jgi:hypothetical protein
MGTPRRAGPLTDYRHKPPHRGGQFWTPIGGQYSTPIDTQTRAAFPDGVTAPVQYGKRIGAFVLYLPHYQLLPEKRLH